MVCLRWLKCECRCRQWGLKRQFQAKVQTLAQDVQVTMNHDGISRYKPRHHSSLKLNPSYDKWLDARVGWERHSRSMYWWKVYSQSLASSTVHALCEIHHSVEVLRMSNDRRKWLTCSRLWLLKGRQRDKLLYLAISPP